MKKKIITEWSTLPIILDTATTALVFGVSTGTIKQWVYQGRLQSTQIGRFHYFDREYVRSLITRGHEYER